MSIHKCEVVKEYIYYIPGITECVKARIIKSTSSGKFIWECSHSFDGYLPCHETDDESECKSELDYCMDKFDVGTARKNTDY